jgi:Uma2 family endonuclease
MATITRRDSNPPPLGDFPEESMVIPSPVPDDCFYEVVDGQIVELPPMGVYECGVATILSASLVSIAKAGKLGRVVAETMFWLNRSGKLKRRPDLAFVSAERWPLAKGLPRAEAWDVVPDLAIEVVSESNSANEIALKLVDYFRAGSAQVWVVYPAIRQVYLYTSATSVRIVAEPDELDGGDLIPGFRLPLTELFEAEPEGEEARPAISN